MDYGATWLMLIGCPDQMNGAAERSSMQRDGRERAKIPRTLSRKCLVSEYGTRVD
jgi:hypothetical protein